LPARPYVFEVVRTNYTIELPRKGNYVDLDPEFFSEEDGGFDLLQDSNKGPFFYTPALSKVLFAKSLYPGLSDSQAFVVTGVNFQEDKVLVIGNVIDMKEEKEG